MTTKLNAMSRPRIDLIGPPFRGHLRPPVGKAEVLREIANLRIFTTADAAGARSGPRATANTARNAAVGLARVYRRDGSVAVYSNEVIPALGQRELEFSQRSPVAGRGEAVGLDPARQNVLVTIGTHRPFRGAEVRRNLAKWAAACPELCFHSSAAGFRGSGAEPRPGENRRICDYVNYEENVRAFDAVVPHASAGITYHALAAGCPAVGMPCDYDQFDFAARLEFHGLAMRCRRAGELPRALRAVLAGEGLRERVGAKAARLRTVDLREELLAVWDEQRVRPRQAVDA